MIASLAVLFSLVSAPDCTLRVVDGIAQGSPVPGVTVKLMSPDRKPLQIPDQTTDTRGEVKIEYPREHEYIWVRLIKAGEINGVEMYISYMQYQELAIERRRSQLYRSATVYTTVWQAPMCVPIVIYCVP